jgi:predicted small secreted protein
MRYRFFRFSLLVCTVLVAGLSWTGCDTMPGVEDSSRTAPVVKAGPVLVSPEVLDTDGLSFSNGKASAEITVSLDIFDADRDATTAFVVIQSPVVGAAPAGKVEVNVAGNGPLSVRVPFELSEGASGNYQVVIFATDSSELMSNQVFGTLQVTAGSEPPVIDQIDIPATVIRPAQGQPSINVPIVAHVSDPDGLDNILGVDVIVNGAVTLKLCDDGGQGTCNAGFGSSGDVTAGDGLFTLTIQLSSSNAAGENVFEFTAIDRSGLRSAQVARIIEVN